MKKSSLIVAAGALLAGSAYAQTSVTLYGIADVSVRYTNHADAAGHSQTQLTDGAVTQSRWGLKGSEDLGNGLKGIFQLENGYSVDNGTLNSSGVLFNRQAYVGLAGSFGAVKLGRQYTEGFNFFGDYDPLTIGNYTANAWPFFLTQFRANNVISYGGKFGGLNVGAGYGFGEAPGSFTKASTSGSPYWGVRAAYEMGPFGIGGVYQEFRDGAGNRQQMWGAAGKYAIGPAKLFLGYVGGKDRTGLIDANFMNVAGGPATGVITAGAVNNPRKDNLGYAGATYQVTPALALTGAFYYDFIENKNGTTASGHRYTGVALAEYAFSKRTQIYGTVDYNHVSGAANTELPNGNNQLGVAAGIRHIF